MYLDCTGWQFGDWGEGTKKVPFHLPLPWRASTWERAFVM